MCGRKGLCVMSIRNMNYVSAVGKAAQTSATRGASPALWQDCPWFELQNGLKSGYAYYDDLIGNYVQAANVAASASTLPEPWAAFTNATAGATVASVVSPTDATGGMKLISTTAQEGVHVGLHAAKNLTALIEPLSSTNRVWFEGRLKCSTITTTEGALFFGLMEVGRLITLGTMATGGGAVAAVDHVGFLKATVTAPSAIQTSIGDGTSTIVNAAAGTLVADTYKKLGFYWNGTIGTFYVDGTADGTTITSASTGFPLAENLALMMGFMAGAAGTSQNATLDWCKVAFERTSNATT